MQAKITKRVVDSAKAIEKRLYVFDTEVKGFGLSVTTSGAKSYFLDYRPAPGGRATPKRRYTIGTHGAPWTPETARREAIRLLGMVKGGQDPAAERTHARIKVADGNTVEAIVKSFIKRYAQQRQRGWRETKRILDKDFVSRFGHRRLDSISRADVVDLLDQVADRGPAMANQVLAAVRKMFNWAVDRSLISANPCNRLTPPGKSESRDRVLSDTELVAIWRAAESCENQTFGIIVRLLAVMGQRRGEVAGLCGSEVSKVDWPDLGFSGHLWQLPGHRAKNGRDHMLPITPLAWGLIEPLIKDRGNALLLPVISRKGEEVTFSAWSKNKAALDDAVLSQLREDAVAEGDDPDKVILEEWTLHDLRRTCSTGMAQLGTPPHVDDAVFNHVSGAKSGVRGTYNRYQYLAEKSIALHGWDNHLQPLLTGEGLAPNVIRMRSGGR